MNVTCNPGYIGGGSWTCGCGGTFSGAACTAAACTSTQVLSSNKATTSSIAGNTTDTMNVTCDAGYAGGGIWTCGSGGTFSGTPCSDIDECATSADNCDTNADCSNNGGSFTCTCSSGYVGDVTSCALVSGAPFPVLVIILIVAGVLAVVGAVGCVVWKNKQGTAPATQIQRLHKHVTQAPAKDGP